MSLAGTLQVTGATTLTGGGSVPNGATVTVVSGGIITFSGTGEINATHILGAAIPSLPVSLECLTYTGAAIAWGTCGSGGSGVTSIGITGNAMAPVFTTSIANPTGAAVITFNLSNSNADTIFGNPTSSSAAPIYFGVSLPLAFGSSLLGCPTCDTSAASLTSNAVVIGGGGQATSTISAATTTTYALFATAGAPAFRAIASSDLPIIPNNLGGLGASFSSATGVVQVVSGTFSASTALANGTTATTQGIGDSTTKVATDQFVLQNAFTNPCTLLGCTIYGGSGGSATALNGPTGPNGVTEVYTSTPSGGAATAPQWSIPGVQLDEQSGTSYTIPATDNYHWVTSANASAVAWSGANMLVNNYAFHGANLLAGTVTYTPASGKVFPGNGSTGLTTQIIPQYWFFEATTDNTNTYMAVMPTISAFPNCNTAGSSALIFTSSTGVIGCNTISGGGSSAFSSITSGTNTTAAMLCGSGCTLGVTGSGTIAATSAPFSGLTPGTNTSITAWEIAPSSTVGGSTPTVYLLGAASETDTGALLKLNTGAASVQPALTVGTANNVQFSVCAQGSGIVVFGSVVPCTSIGTPATGNVIVEANGTNLQALREWAPNASYIGTMNRWNNATAPGTGYQFVQAYAGVTSTDTTNGGGTLVFEVLGNGSIDVGIWNGSVIGTQYGGLGGNFNASSGIPVFTGGSVSVTTTLPNGINIGAATASSLLVTGTLDGQVPVAITTGSTANLGSVYNSGYTFNQNTTAAQAITYTLPTPVPGKQYCVKNSTYGAAPDTGAITLIVANTGTQSLIYNGINSSSGYIVSAGQAGDGACAVAITTTQWEIYVQQGSWNLH